VTQLPKPTTAAWLLNQLVRDQPDQVSELMVLGDALRQAQEKLAGPQLRQLSQQRHEVIAGFTRKALAPARRAGRPVTAELAAQVLQGLYPDLQRRAGALTVAQIQQSTADAFGVSVDALVSTSRAVAVAWPRQIAMYLARELTPLSLPAIGHAFGGRSHTTVLHACRRTTERIAEDAHEFEVVRRLRQSLGQETPAS